VPGLTSQQLDSSPWTPQSHRCSGNESGGNFLKVESQRRRIGMPPCFFGEYNCCADRTYVRSVLTYAARCVMARHQARTQESYRHVQSESGKRGEGEAMQ
jgi:hypothetical protein